MKKLFVVFVAIAISAGAYAQTGLTNGTTSPKEVKSKQNQNESNNPQDLKKNQNQNMQNNSFDKSHPDGVMMQNGKMMQVKNGQLSSLDNDVTLSNGTKIMSDGTCIKKDGTKMTMKEGQHMDMSGNLTPMKTNKDNNMYLVPDSTKKKSY